MKGCINQKGELLIKRGKIFIDQFCHFVSVPDWTCSDKCPHFGEPDVVYDNNKVTRIQLCHGKTLYFDEFVDERMKVMPFMPGG